MKHITSASPIICARITTLFFLFQCKRGSFQKENGKCFWVVILLCCDPLNWNKTTLPTVNKQITVSFCVSNEMRKQRTGFMLVCAAWQLGMLGSSPLSFACIAVRLVDPLALVVWRGPFDTVNWSETLSFWFKKKITLLTWLTPRTSGNG